MGGLMLDLVYLMIEPGKLALWAVTIGMIALAILCFMSAARLTSRQLDLAKPNHKIQDAKDVIIMALLDDIAAQTAAIEATDAAAAVRMDADAAKITDLTSQLAAANAALAAAGEDVATANALAARLKVANDALQAKVAA